jgi:hypothetical protein
VSTVCHQPGVATGRGEYRMPVCLGCTPLPVKRQQCARSPHHGLATHSTPSGGAPSGWQAHHFSVVVSLTGRWRTTVLSVTESLSCRCPSRPAAVGPSSLVGGAQRLGWPILYNQCRRWRHSTLRHWNQRETGRETGAKSGNPVSLVGRLGWPSPQVNN